MSDHELNNAITSHILSYKVNIDSLLPERLAVNNRGDKR